MPQLIIVVDKNDNIIDYKPRDIVDKEGLIYRVASLWIKNSKGESLLARRAYTKSHSPGKWGPAVEGTVEKGETYEQNVIKEAEEELGLKNIKPRKATKIYSKYKHYSEGRYKRFIQLFLIIIDKPAEDFQIQKEEVAEVKWFSKEELKQQLKNNPEDFVSQMPEYFDVMG